MEEKFTLNWSGALKGGVFLALILIVYSVLQYAFDLMTISLVAASIIGLLNLVLTFFGLWFFGVQYRKNYAKGDFSWGNAFVVLFIISVVSLLIGQTYNYVFNTYIDPDYLSSVFEKMRSLTEDMLINVGMDEDQIEMQLEKMDEASNVSTGNQLMKGIIYGTIIGLVVSLIVAAIIKKKNPVFE